MEQVDSAREQAAAQYASVAEMVGALNCDFDRLEELEEAREPFAAGWNYPGCLPENGAATFADFDDAKQYIVDAIDEQIECFEAEVDRLVALLETEKGGFCDNGLTTAENSETLEEMRRNIEHAGAVLAWVKEQTEAFTTGRVYGLVYWVNEAANDGLPESDYAELLELREQAGDYSDEDGAWEAIQNDALSVDVRSDWESAGGALTPSEFRILLCTGGPAVQIRGELDGNKIPCRAWIEYQDWFTPWTEYHGEEVDVDVLLTYCQQFYFGE